MNGIRSIRKQLGLSQQELGELLGKTQGNVSLYEVAGQTVPPGVAQRVIEIAKDKGFECTFNDVYSDSPTLTPLEADVAAPAAQAA